LLNDQPRLTIKIGEKLDPEGTAIRMIIGDCRRRSFAARNFLIIWLHLDRIRILRCKARVERAHKIEQKQIRGLLISYMEILTRAAGSFEKCPSEF
jgi:hypothetical protein